MKLTYDPKNNIAYLRLHARTAKVQTISISDELNVDMTPDGTVYGIELLNANEQIETEADGAMVVVDRVAHRTRKRPLAVRENSSDYAAQPQNSKATTATRRYNDRPAGISGTGAGRRTRPERNSKAHTKDR